MGKLSWIGEPGVLATDRMDEDMVLAAALAATLVAYRQQVQPPASGDGAGGQPNGSTSASGWRMLGRWEQLRGGA